MKNFEEKKVIAVKAARKLFDLIGTDSNKQLIYPNESEADAEFRVNRAAAIYTVTRDTFAFALTDSTASSPLTSVFRMEFHKRYSARSEYEIEKGIKQVKP